MATLTIKDAIIESIYDGEDDACARSQTSPRRRAMLDEAMISREHAQRKWASISKNGY